MRGKKNYTMIKLQVPKRVTLPNGRTFVARYKRIWRGELPPNIVMRRTYTPRAPPRGRTRRIRAQEGQGIFDFVEKVARNPLVKSIAKKGLEYAPGVYHNLTKRVKNKTLKRMPNLDAAHYEIIKKINGKYPFSIFNTDKENESGVRWWGFMDIHPKNNLFLFDSFGVEGFKHFIVNTGQKTINELLCNFKKCENNSSQKLKLCTMKFYVETWQKKSQKSKDQLTDTAQNFFHLLEQFAKLKKTHCMNVLILENSIQDIISSNCGEFQLYFYKNLFDPDEKSKILNHQTLNKSTLETIINEIFSTDVAENKHIFNNFKEEWIVNYFCFIIGKNSKTNNQVFIPSNGIGELYLDVFDMHWYHYESSFFNIDKKIPFMK